MAVKLGNGNWAVKEDKLLAYNDNSGLFFNKEFDFSRGTSATYVAKDGLIKTAGIQPNIVNNGDFSELGSELVTNGDFTDWTADNPDGWTVTNEDANNYVTQDGTYARIVSNDTASIQIRQTIFTIGKVYKVELDAVVNSGNVEGLKLNDATAAASIGYVNSTGHHTFYFRASGTVFVINRKGGGDTDILIDNVSIKQVDPNDYWTLGTGWSLGDNRATSDASTNSYLNQQVYEIGKTYKLGFEVLQGTIELRSAQYSKGTGFYTTGTYSIEVIPTTISTHFYVYTGFGQSSITNITVQEIETDTPRIDFTNDTKGHLLLEPSTTNLIPYSEDFSQSSWVKLGAGTGTTAIVTSDYAISPDGTQNASRLQCDLNGGGSSSSNQSLIYNLYSSSGSQALSIYMKSNNGENQTIYFANTQTSGDTVTVTSEWQRFTFTHSTSTYVLAVGLRGRSGGAINDTADILIWGAQAEAGDYSTSLINTTGATSTRNADVCNNSGSAQDFNSEEGVLYAEIASLASDGTYREMGLSDNTLNTRVVFSYTNTPNRIRGNVKIASSSTAFNLFYTTTDETDFIKVAVKFKSGDYALWVNGVERATNTTSDIFAVNELTHLNFTSGTGSSSPMFGKVRNVQVFTEALTDEQLEKLTS